MLQDFKLSKLIPGFNRRHVVMLGAHFIYLACASYWVCDGKKRRLLFSKYFHVCCALMLTRDSFFKTFLFHTSVFILTGSVGNIASWQEVQRFKPQTVYFG